VSLDTGGSFHREFHAPAGLAGDKADIPAVARPDKESEPVGLTARTPADQPDLGSASLSTFQAKIDAKRRLWRVSDQTVMPPTAARSAPALQGSSTVIPRQDRRPLR
jgi:hypothetical protein